MEKNLYKNSPKLVDLGDIMSRTNPLLKVMRRPSEYFLGLSEINKGYANLYKKIGSTDLQKHFFHHMCEEFNLHCCYDEDKLMDIPHVGPVVILSNHPFGLADGLLLGKLLTDIRPDVKLVANKKLEVCNEIIPWIISVDPYESTESRMNNLVGTREMLKHLHKGGILGVFPAGGASSYNIQDKCVIDDNWNENIASIIRKTKATVVTLHFSGRNSLLFQIVSLIKKEARLALLPREFKKHTKKPVNISIGSPIASHTLDKFNCNRSMIDHLRLLTYYQGRKQCQKKHKSPPETSRKLEQIIHAVSPRILLTEVTQLPDSAILLQSGDYIVYHAYAKEIPNMLREIGRQREITFREVGGGSGKSCDIDSYDAYYIHIFLWDEKNNQLVGGYRVGETDKILFTKGVEGLYNAQFFEFKRQLIERISPGLEMGRSFIIPEYQKRPILLGLIWQGIGQFVSRNPEYRYLFGVVSTSAQYDTFSFKLMVDFLKLHSMDQELANYLKPKNPLKGKALKPSEIESIENSSFTEQDLNNWLSHLESDGKGLPVLLRQYLKLNGKILGFNIDKDFGGVLDCMILVDLKNSPKKSLQKYFGNDIMKKYADYTVQKELCS